MDTDTDTAYVHKVHKVQTDNLDEMNVPLTHTTPDANVFCVAGIDGSDGSDGSDLAHIRTWLREQLEAVRAFTTNEVRMPPAGYRAPELLLQDTLRISASAVYMWTVGCLFGEILLQAPLFAHSDSPGVELQSMLKILGTIRAEAVWSQSTLRAACKDWYEPRVRALPSRLEFLLEFWGVDLLERMLHYDPSKRISIDDIFNHPFFLDL